MHRGPVCTSDLRLCPRGVPIRTMARSVWEATFGSSGARGCLRAGGVSKAFTRPVPSRLRGAPARLIPMTHVEGRWVGSTGVSVAAHLVLFAILLLTAARISQVKGSSDEAPVIYLHTTAGIGGDKGGSGQPDATPARPARLPRATFPASTLTPSNVEPP